MEVTFIGGPYDGAVYNGRFKVGDTIHMPLKVPIPKDGITFPYRVELTDGRWEAVLI